MREKVKDFLPVGCGDVVLLKSWMGWVVRGLGRGSWDCEVLGEIGCGSACCQNMLREKLPVGVLSALVPWRDHSLSTRGKTCYSSNGAIIKPSPNTAHPALKLVESVMQVPAGYLLGLGR